MLRELILNSGSLELWKWMIMTTFLRVFWSESVRFRNLMLTALLVVIFPLGHACAEVLPRCDQPIADLYEKISPAVVTITGQSINPYRRAGRVSHTIGSGFIVDAGGLVLTNSHVAFGRQSLRVTLDDGTVVPARVLGADPIFDIAVVEIPKPDKGTLRTVPTGDSDKIRGGYLEVTVGTTSILFGGDIVTSINGTGMDDPQKLAPTLRALTVGDKVKLTVYREGEVREVEFVLPERPLMPSDLPEGQSFVIGPRRGTENASPTPQAK